MAVFIRKIDDLQTVNTLSLVKESEAEGYRFLRRLVDQYEEGINRFDQSGEALYGVWDESGQLVAIGGLSRNPYTEDGKTARLRRFYVSPSMRRQGIGTQLLDALVNHAQNHFNLLVLRTDSASADAFYRANGFSDLKKPEMTHQMQLMSSSETAN